MPKKVYTVDDQREPGQANFQWDELLQLGNQLFEIENLKSEKRDDRSTRWQEHLTVESQRVTTAH